MVLICITALVILYLWAFFSVNTLLAWEVSVIILAPIFVILVLFWQHRRDWREDRAIAAWIAFGLVWFDAKVFRLWDAIVGWCMGW